MPDARVYPYSDAIRVAGDLSAAYGTDPEHWLTIGNEIIADPAKAGAALYGLAVLLELLLEWSLPAAADGITLEEHRRNLIDGAAAAAERLDQRQVTHGR